MNKKNTIIECLCDISVEFESAESIIPIISRNSDFNDIKKLPVNQIPEVIRKSDPDLRKCPLYAIKSKNSQSSILLGDYMIGIKTGDYTGWEYFLEEGKEIFESILNKQEIGKIERIGLRYINFFKEKDVFKTSQISLRIANRGFEDGESDLRVVIKKPREEIVCIMNIANNQSIERKKGSVEKGSIIDIIVAYENNNIPKDEVFDKINKLHDSYEQQLKNIVGEN